MKSEYYEVSYQEINEDYSQEEIEQMEIDAQNEIDREFLLLERMASEPRNCHPIRLEVNIDSYNDDQPPF